MKPRYADEAAFPRDAVRFSTPEDHENTLLPTQWGLTRRELFAIEIMAGQAASEGNGGEFWADDEKMAKRAVRRADALLAELSKVQS